MRKSLLILLCVVLSGCSYSLALMKRGGSEVAYGTASDVGDKVEIALNGKTYRGNYSFVRQGFSSFGTSQAFSTKGAYAFGTSQSYGSSSVGNGNILARADDGSGLRCVFQYSSRSMSGIGECQDDDGGIWDMQISVGAPRAH